MLIYSMTYGVLGAWKLHFGYHSYLAREWQIHRPPAGSVQRRPQRAPDLSVPVPRELQTFSRQAARCRREWIERPA